MSHEGISTLQWRERKPNLRPNVLGILILNLNHFAEISLVKIEILYGWSIFNLISNHCSYFYFDLDFHRLFVRAVYHLCCGRRHMRMVLEFSNLFNYSWAVTILLWVFSFQVEFIAVLFGYLYFS